MSDDVYVMIEDKWDMSFEEYKKVFPDKFYKFIEKCEEAKGLLGPLSSCEHPKWKILFIRMP